MSSCLKRSCKSQWLDTLQKSWYSNRDFECFWSNYYWYFLGSLDWSFQSWITLVLTEYFLARSVLSLPTETRIWSFWPRIFCNNGNINFLTSRATTFGRFGRWQHYREVLDIICKLHTKNVFEEDLKALNCALMRLNQFRVDEWLGASNWLFDWDLL